MELKQDINLMKCTKKHALLFLPGIAVFLVGFMLLIIGQYHTKNNELNRLNDELIQLSKEKQDINNNLSGMVSLAKKNELKLKETKDDIQRAISVLNSLNERIVWSEFILSISNNIPKNMWITNLSTGFKKTGQDQDIQIHEMVISGFARTHKEIAIFISRVENSRELNDISLSYVKQTYKDEMKQEYFEYMIKAIINDSNITSKRAIL